MNSPLLSKKAQKTREHVLDISLELMKKNGYQNTTVRDICSTADISVGTFYSYFPSKTDLFLDIYKKADDYFSDNVAVKINGSNAKERVVDFFRYYARLNVETGTDLLGVLYNPENLWFASRRPMHKVLADIIADGLERNELASDLSADEMVDYLFTVARGCCYSWCVTEGEYDLEDQIVRYTELALKAFQSVFLRE